MLDLANAKSSGQSKRGCEMMRASDSGEANTGNSMEFCCDGPTSHCGKAAMQVVPHSELASRCEDQNLPFASGSESRWEAYGQKHFHKRLYFRYLQVVLDLERAPNCWCQCVQAFCTLLRSRRGVAGPAEIGARAAMQDTCRRKARSHIFYYCYHYGLWVGLLNLEYERLYVYILFYIGL